MTFVYIVAAVIILPAVYVVSVYNLFVKKSNHIKNVSSSVDALLKKRYDLIPNLVACVKGYVNHERGVLEQLTTLRSKALDLHDIDKEINEVGEKISQDIKTIFAVSENYPDLKANESFLHLQASLTEAEEQIAAGRRAYNAVVADYNSYLQSFPAGNIGRVFGFKDSSYFTIVSAQNDNSETDI
jgi:LemA protein